MQELENIRVKKENAKDIFNNIHLLFNSIPNFTYSYDLVLADKLIGGAIRFKPCSTSATTRYISNDRSRKNY
jgi:hypothetical protein